MKRVAIGLAVALLAPGLTAAAQTAAPSPVPPGPSIAGPALPGAAAVPAKPGDVEALNRANTELILTLLRTTLVALQQANQTGNYTVLRDLGAPDFAAKNSASDLTNIFASLRAARIDMAPVVLLDPQISRATLTPEKKLYVTGALATKPFPITFELLFLPIDGVWRFDGLSITPVQDLAAPRPAPVLKSTPPAAPPPPPRHKPIQRPHVPQPAPARPAPVPPKSTGVPATSDPQ